MKKPKKKPKQKLVLANGRVVVLPLARISKEIAFLVESGGVRAAFKVPLDVSSLSDPTAALQSMLQSAVDAAICVYGKLPTSEARSALRRARKALGPGSK